ncbi:glycosyltransferase [Pediococcus ethanolidurans]|uniref:Glycosyl transferase family 2 n=1 Tax=Pediococcus ethanolidurans TaxID=319653 RepID=A0A0R2K5L5_9LACO|nr:glycosyltransferase [Pediococcus ethanolidurans]KRN81476.1 glycosyltransferase [Pediococcus ethanolidurans]GEN95257.1 glycosyl transferase [Pediococcus ethanolidurans]SER60955.1 Glycosyl transferase family 2 [Pediococcus ethanolidurans]
MSQFALENEQVLIYTGLMSIYFKEKPKNLKISLESIIKQKLLPSEMVVIEDGTFNEKLKKVLIEFQRACEKLHISFKIINHKVNKGLGKSLNEGLKYCSNNYVARFDSDDINLPDRMEKTMKVFQYNGKLSVVGSNVQEFGGNRGHIEKRVPLTSSKIMKLSKFRNPMNHMSVTFKKNIVESVGGYEDVPYFEDYYLWLKMLKGGYVFKNISQSLVLVRVDENFYSRRGGIQYAKKELKFQVKIFKMGYISFPRFVFNCIVRAIPRFFPKKLLAVVYKIVRHS